MFAETQQPVFLQEDWTGPLATQRLAQLLHSMSSGKVPLTLKAPLTIEVPDGVTPIHIRNWSNGNTVMTFTDLSGATENTVTVGTGGVNTSVGGGGGTTTTTVTGGGGLAGTVVSGSGSAYVVSLDDGGGSVAVEQRPSSTDDIPVGTKVVVFTRANGTRFMNVQVWL